MSMTEQERTECLVAAAALTGFSRISLLIFFTTPSIFILLQGNALDAVTLVLLVLFLLSALFLALRCWHLYFDAVLFKSMGDGNAGIGEVDLLLMHVFKKDLKGKPLTERIAACYRLSRGLFVGMAVHVAVYAGMLFWLLKG